MRHTKLNRTTAAVIIAVVVAIAAIAFLRSRLPALHAQARAAQPPTADQGVQLFKDKGCGQCHYTDSTENKLGPGLKNIFQQKELPASNRPPTRENVRRQIVDPYGRMPSFADRLTHDEIRAIIDYLQTL